MNISYRWLRDLAPTITETPQEIADRLAMLGAPVDEIVNVGEKLRDVVIARTRSVQRHPNADRLSLCEVDAGGEILQVVCGAPNVKANTYYPFAPVGSTLPGDFTIKKAKIRGMESQGMLCSARELELGRDHDGILELHGEFTPGQSFIEAVGLDDARIVVDVTPNRGDLLSHYGIAREVAPGGEADLTGPHTEEHPHQFPHPHPGSIALRVDDADGCARYIGIEIEGVTIAPSPEWLSARLRAIGARPINNVVDATNYVLHELGQPLHAFDRDKLGGKQIIVRRAKQGETLKTLDGEDRKLDTSMLVIADGEKATAIAGVMGGLESEVTNETTSILLECALFDPKTVRKTRTTLGLSTDASYRFERGVDVHMMLKAVGRAVRIILDTAGGKVAGSTDVYAREVEDRTIALRPARVKQVLGQAFDMESITKLLEPIGFKVASDGNVTVPGHRMYDVAREIDLVEEVARRFGYNNFPTELLPFRPSAVPEDGLALLESRIRDVMVGRGFLEARTAAFAPEAEGDVALMHPLSSAESRLRRELLPALFKRVEYNLNRGARNVRLFEIGTAFSAAPTAFATGKDLPQESTRLAIAFTGLRNPAHWTGKAEAFDIWDLKSLVADVARVIGIESIATSGPVSVIEGGFAGTANGAQIVGGRLRRDYIDAPAWAGEFFGIEAVLPAGGYAADKVTYAALALHPPTEQDIALLVPEAISSEAIETVIRKSGGVYLEGVHAFDLYRGAGIPAGTRSIAYRLRFRASDRTLTDAEADDAVRKVLDRLKDEHGVERRG